MSQDQTGDLPAFLAGGRRLLDQANDRYERSLSTEEYWWLGVGLAAATLAELSEKPYAVGRLEQLIDRLGYRGVKGDWLQRFVEELANLDAEGLLWPLYERTGDGRMESTGHPLSPTFGAPDGYFLALAHIGVALAVHQEEQERVSALAATIAALVEGGVTPGHEALILDSLRESSEGGE